MSNHNGKISGHPYKLHWNTAAYFCLFLFAERVKPKTTFKIVDELLWNYFRFRGIMRVRWARTRSETCPASPQTSPTWPASAPTIPNMDIPVISSHHQVFFIFFTQYIQKVMLVSCFNNYSVVLVNKNYAYSSFLSVSSFPLVEFCKKYCATDSVWPGVDLRFWSIQISNCGCCLLWKLCDLLLLKGTKLAVVFCLLLKVHVLYVQCIQYFNKICVTCFHYFHGQYGISGFNRSSFFANFLFYSTANQLLSVN